MLQKLLTLINKDRDYSQQSECILEYSYLSIFLKMKIDRFNLIVMKLYGTIYLFFTPNAL